MALDYNIIGERLKEARVNKKYTQESDLNKLDSLVTRLSLNGLTREEYYELRDLMSKYKNQINQQESINYEKIIDENQSKIR